MATVADILLARGEQDANRRRRQGEISGQMWRNLGDIAIQAGQSVQRQQEQAPRLAMEKMAVQDANQRQQGQQVIDRALQPYQPVGPQPEGEPSAPAQHPYLDDQTGLFDTSKLSDVLASHGLAHLAPDLLKPVESINESITKHQKAEQDLNNSTAVMYGDLAHGVLQLQQKTGLPIDQAMDLMAQPALATNRIKPQQYQQIKAQIAAFPPEQQTSALTSYMDAAAKITGDETLAKDAVKLDRYGRQLSSNVVAPPPTEASLALQAAGGSPAGAMALLKPAGKPTAEEEKARYISIRAKVAAKQPVPDADLNWAKGYEDEKKITVDTSASAAADRQTATIGAQIAQQRRTQDFEALKEARAAIQKDVNTPYLTAKTSADTLRDTVAAAQAGNKIAGSLQALETTMSAIRAQGLNRINTAEIGVAGNAGSMYDRIKGWLGKAAEGQPVPADVQKDMIAFADILEKAAYKKYKEGHAATNKLYGTSIPEMLTAPSTTDQQGSQPSGVPTVGATFQGGKVLKVEKVQ